jgi:hypothetical protein
MSEESKYQQQLLLTMKAKKETENKSTTTYVIKNPLLFFVKIVPNLENKKYIYWYCYSVGKIRNIFWGVYKRTKHEFLTQGMCHFRYLEALNETINYKRGLGFALVSTLSENKIDQTINRYLPESLHFQCTVNRSDLNTEHRYNQIIRTMTDDFLKYAERNETHGSGLFAS